MNWNQPLRFSPIYQTRVWGGRNLQTEFGRQLPDQVQPYGESWEISDRPEADSVVVEGATAGLTLHGLWTQHRESVFGQDLVDHPSERFPLLMKILDACDDLSIQVHPPASIAADLGGEPKTEMWVITHAQPEARLYAGLRSGVTQGDFEQALKDGSVAGLMHVIEPNSGDCLFLPSGRVHAIGAGLVIFEIQQNSDTTYRVFDWNRTGLDGRPRALHVKESLSSIDFQDYEPAVQASEPDGTLVRCEHFVVGRKQGATGSLGRAGEHLTVALLSGSLSLSGGLLKAGDFVLIPAAMAERERVISDGTPDVQWLEIRIPTPQNATR